MDRRALLTGFFSTVGDIESLKVVEKWLQRENIAYDVAPYRSDLAQHLSRSITYDAVVAQSYSHFIVICGPSWPGVFAEQGVDLWRFEHCIRIGINLTMIVPLEQWNPFDVLIERDSSRASRPDLSLLCDTGRVPVVATCFIEQQGEYGARQRHAEVVSAVEHLISTRNLARISVDTRWPKMSNRNNLGSAQQVLSSLGRADAVITNRLHGLIFSLKAGVPALVLDGIHGGDKVSRQARILGWPACEIVDNLSRDKLSSMLDWCLTQQAHRKVAQVYESASRKLDNIEDELLSSVCSDRLPSPVPDNTTKLSAHREASRRRKRRTPSLTRLLQVPAKVGRKIMSAGQQAQR